MPNPKIRTRFAPSPTGYMHVEGDQIILKKHRPAGSCDFCGELVAGMAQYEGYCICPACRAKIAAL